MFGFQRTSNNFRRDRETAQQAKVLPAKEPEFRTHVGKKRALLTLNIHGKHTEHTSTHTHAINKCMFPRLFDGRL